MKLTILGSTGSIGTQTLSIVRDNPCFEVEAITGNKNIKLLEEQAREFKPRLVCTADEDAAASLRQSLADRPVKVMGGAQSICEAAADPASDLSLIHI